MTILALIALVLALWLAKVNSKLAKENESYERILNEYAKRLSHEKGLREQAEEAVIQLQAMTSKLSAHRMPNASSTTNKRQAKVKVLDMQETSNPKPKKQKSATVH